MSGAEEARERRGGASTVAQGLRLGRWWWRREEPMRTRSEVKQEALLRAETWRWGQREAGRCQEGGHGPQQKVGQDAGGTVGGGHEAETAWHPLGRCHLAGGGQAGAWGEVWRGVLIWSPSLLYPVGPLLSPGHTAYTLPAGSGQPGSGPSLPQAPHHHRAGPACWGGGPLCELHQGQQGGLRELQSLVSTWLLCASGTGQGAECLLGTGPQWCSLYGRGSMEGCLGERVTCWLWNG